MVTFPPLVDSPPFQGLPSNSTLERQNSMPNVNHLRQSSNPTSGAPCHSKTLSLPRSSSGISIEGQLSSTASGYAATGSGSSLDAKSFIAPPLPNHKMESQYLLQKLLAQQYTPDTTDFDLLDPPPLDQLQNYHGTSAANVNPPPQAHSHMNHSADHVAHREQKFSHTAGRSITNSLRHVPSDFRDHANITVEV